MTSTKLRRSTSLLVLAFLALLVAPALSWGDKKDDKKPAAPQPKPSAPAPKSAAPAGHSSSQPGTQQGHATGTPGHTTGTPGHQSGTPGHSTGTPGHQSGTPGQTTGTPGHPTGLVTPGGKAIAGRKQTQQQLSNGQTATVSRRSNGAAATIQTKGMTISHPLRGPMTVVKESNGRRIVATGRQGGYVERPYLNRGGRSYVQRTYVVGGRSYVSVYRSYSYGGVVYYGYAPAYYYQPVYYGWAYNPWGAPVVYGPAAWGWAGSPWYGYYPGYFTPYAAYASASQWLTDYLLAANLQAAYAANAKVEAPAADAASAGTGGAAASAGQTPLSPEVKQMIAEEVKNQLAAAQSAASSKGAAPAANQLPDALNPAERIFVVSSHLDVATAAGKECGLAPGDVVMRMTDAPDANQNVTASVQSSKKADCAAGQTVSIGVQDLQEMHNQFRQQLDSGLQTLASNAGKGGLPQAPDTSTTSGEVPAPMPDKSAAEQLQGAQQEGEAIDNAVQHGAAGG